MNPYYTHQEYLKRELDNLDYSKKIKCLEFGSGHGSSSIFREYVDKNPNFDVQCYEHDKEWLNNMSVEYQTTNYVFNQVVWSDFDYDKLKNDVYDVVFVDQGEWEARITTIDELISVSRCIILHDYCYYNGFRGGSIPEEDKDWALDLSKDSFFGKKYSKNFELIGETSTFPPTLIMKNKNKKL